MGNVLEIEVLRALLAHREAGGAVMLVILPTHAEYTDADATRQAFTDDPPAVIHG